MGTALAACLVEKGHEVTVWNRTPARAASLVAAGARAADDAAAAVAASPLVVVCIRSHGDTLALLEPLGAALAGRTICDLSSGETEDAERLFALVKAGGGDPMLGMINAYPSGIGKAETAILTVGSEAAWAAHGDIIRTLGGGSARVGDAPRMLAALFAGLFTVRQGFMFGMIYGALACRKAGIPMQVFADQIPVSMGVMDAYYQVFAKTVPAGDFDNAEASMQVYADALKDVLETVKALDAPSEFVQLLHDRTRAAVADGLADKQLTALTEHMLR